MIDEKFEKILLIDIGTAEFLKIEEAVVGSPMFMSPEIF
jgi:hypothetical protein